MMKHLFIVITCLYACTCFSQDSINPPINLKFGMSLTDYKIQLEKKLFANGRENFMNLNHFENYIHEYDLSSYSYLTCQPIGTIKPAYITGLFSRKKLAIVSIGFRTSTTYAEVKNILLSKYNSPVKDTIQEIQNSSIYQVTEWVKNDKLIRLYSSIAENSNAPKLEYIDLSMLNIIRREKAELNKSAYR